MNDGSALETYVTDLLRAAGLDPQKRELVGARGSKVFDVVVDMTALGFSGTWVIECKDWVTKVKRTNVSGFCEEVQNVGADKGVMVSTMGYQSGCAATVENRNVVLVTPAEFEDSLGNQIAWEQLRQARPRLDGLGYRLERMHVRGTRIGGKPAFRRGMDEHFPSGPDSDLYAERCNALRVLLGEVTGVLAGNTYYQLPDLNYREDPDNYPPDDWDPTVKVDNVREFASAVTGYLTDWEAWADELIPPP